MEKKTTRCCHWCHSTRSCTKEGLHTTTKFSSPTVIPQSHMLTHTTSSPPCSHGHLTTHLHNFISTMQPRPPHNSPMQPYLPLMHSHNSPHATHGLHGSPTTQPHAHPHNFISTMQSRPSHSSPTQLHIHHATTTIHKAHTAHQVVVPPSHALTKPTQLTKLPLWKHTHNHRQLIPLTMPTYHPRNMI